MKSFIIAFIGNKEVQNSHAVLKKIFSFLEELFGNEYCDLLSVYPVFYCGGYGQFSQIASDAIDLFRKRYPERKSKKFFITPYLSPLI